MHRRMEAGNGLFDDKAKVRASSTAELQSAGEDRTRTASILLPVSALGP